MVNIDPSSIGQQIGQEALQQTQQAGPADSKSVDAFDRAFQGQGADAGMGVQQPQDVMPGPAEVGGLHQTEQPNMLSNLAQSIQGAAQHYNSSRSEVVASLQNVNKDGVSDIRGLMNTQLAMSRYGIQTQMISAVAKQVQGGLKTLLQNQ